MISLILFIVLLAPVFVILFTVPPKQADHQRIDELERELKIGPPYHSEFPRHKKPTIIERIW